MTEAQEVAFRLKKNPEMVNTVIQSFIQGLSFYLRNPDIAKGKIRIDGLCTFSIREASLGKTGSEEKKEYHEKILNNIEKHRRKNARQKSKPKINAGHDD